MQLQQYPEWGVKPTWDRKSTIWTTLNNCRLVGWISQYANILEMRPSAPNHPNLYPSGPLKEQLLGHHMWDLHFVDPAFQLNLFHLAAPHIYKSGNLRDQSWDTSAPKKDHKKWPRKASICLNAFNFPHPLQWSAVATGNRPSWTTVGFFFRWPNKRQHIPDHE